MIKLIRFIIIAAIACSVLTIEHVYPQSGKQKMVGMDACSLLTPELISSLAGIKSESLKKVNSFANYSNCNYEWERQDKDKIEKENTQILKNSIGSGKIPRLKSTKCKTSLLIEPKYPNKDLAQKSFNSIIKNGVGAKKSSYADKIRGIGDNSAWSEDAKKLTILKGVYIIHIIADISDNNSKNLEFVKKIAAVILKKI